MNNLYIRALVTDGNNVFVGGEALASVGGDWGGLYLSTNNGSNWRQVNDGLSNHNIGTLLIHGNKIYAGTNGGLNSATISEISSVENEITSSSAFSLFQNYPNPFNPSTTISFVLPSKSFVSLKVFDALGREISVLVSEELSPGTYKQQWNPVGLASGVYFYRLQAGTFTETKKLLLLR